MVARVNTNEFPSSNHLRAAVDADVDTDVEWPDRDAGTQCRSWNAEPQGRGLDGWQLTSVAAGVALINVVLHGPLDASPSPIFSCHRAAVVPCIMPPSLAATESAGGKVISFVSLPFSPLRSPRSGAFFIMPQTNKQKRLNWTTELTRIPVQRYRVLR